MDPRTIMTTIVLAMLLAIAAVPLKAAEPEPTTLVRRHWFVSGQVQGVSFRAFTYESATDLKLKGWVRNLTDGRVEIVAEGGEKAVAQFLEKVKKGPPASRVD